MSHGLVKRVVETTYIRQIGSREPIEHKCANVIYVFRLPPNVTRFIVREGERNV
jgi:hypothetical protein